MKKYTDALIDLINTVLKKDEEIRQLNLLLVQRPTLKDTTFYFGTIDGDKHVVSDSEMVQRCIYDLEESVDKLIKENTTLKNSIAKNRKSDKKHVYKINYGGDRVTAPSVVQEYIHECEIRMGYLEAEKAELAASLEGVKKYQKDVREQQRTEDLARLQYVLDHTNLEEGYKNHLIEGYKTGVIKTYTRKLV